MTVHEVYKQTYNWGGHIVPMMVPLELRWSITNLLKIINYSSTVDRTLTQQKSRFLQSGPLKRYIYLGVPHNSNNERK